MRVQSVTVCPDRVDIVVSVDGDTPMRTSAIDGMSERVIETLPGLGTHRCENGADLTFADELADTELPHLFEHVVLELMARAGSPRTLRGETAWDFKRDGHGIFRVSLEYDDDLVCLGAIKTADRVMGYLLGRGECPDLVAEADRLLSLRGWPAMQPA
jgi:hypothetical protein